MTPHPGLLNSAVSMYKGAVDEGGGGHTIKLAGCCWIPVPERNNPPGGGNPFHHEKSALLSSGIKANDQRIICMHIIEVEHVNHQAISIVVDWYLFQASQKPGIQKAHALDFFLKV